MHGRRPLVETHDEVRMSFDEVRQHEKYDPLIARCRGSAPIPPAVAQPCDESSLSGAIDRAELVQDGRARTNHRGCARWTAGLRQRNQ